MGLLRVSSIEKAAAAYHASDGASRPEWAIGACKGRHAARPASFSGQASRSSSFLQERHRAAVADRIGELCRARDQFLPRPTELQRTLGGRADQDVEELWVDSAFEAFGRRIRAFLS